MDTFAYQFPIPFKEIGFSSRKTGPRGNSPYPLGLLQMPMAAAALLYYRAKFVQRTVEWTPLSDGPGERIDYTGATGWDGEKFVFTGPLTSCEDPLGWQAQAWPYKFLNLATDEDVRRYIRKYDPLDPEWPPEPPPEEPPQIKYAPGEWIGITRKAEEGNSPNFPFGGVRSEVDGSMRYDLPIDWEQAKLDFIQANASALENWKTRLEDWLAAEQAKPVQNTPLIADIQRQIDVQQALVLQITTEQTAAIQEIDDYRLGDGEETDYGNRWATNCLAAEQEAFSKWIAAEEILEAFAVTTFPLLEMRMEFRQWVTLMMDSKALGWKRFPSYSPGIEILGGRLTTRHLNAITTASIGAVSSKAIPALDSAELGMILAKPVAQIEIAAATGFTPALGTSDLPAFQTSQSDVWKNSGAEDYSTIFEIKSDPYTVILNYPTQQDKAIETQQITSILYVGIGPTTIGFDAASCSVPLNLFGNIPTYLPPVKIGGYLFSGSTDELVSCPAFNPECNPYFLQFNELYDPFTGAQKEYAGAGVATGNAGLEWAFQSPYATWTPPPPPPEPPPEDPPEIDPGTFNVAPLRTLWQPAVSAIQEHNTSKEGTVCGKFRITNPDNLTVYETDLYATPNTVASLNIIWKITELRD